MGLKRIYLISKSYLLDNMYTATMTADELVEEFTAEIHEEETTINKLYGNKKRNSPFAGGNGRILDS